LRPTPSGHRAYLTNSFGKGKASGRAKFWEGQSFGKGKVLGRARLSVVPLLASNNGGFSP
jgi:hypothetical protein